MIGRPDPGCRKLCGQLCGVLAPLSDLLPPQDRCGNQSGQLCGALALLPPAQDNGLVGLCAACALAEAVSWVDTGPVDLFEQPTLLVTRMLTAVCRRSHGSRRRLSAQRAAWPTSRNGLTTRGATRFGGSHSHRPEPVTRCPWAGTQWCGRARGGRAAEPACRLRNGDGVAGRDEGQHD